MHNLEKSLEPKCYKFNWSVVGYDGCTSKITSPTFRVNFEVSDFEMELDLSELQPGECSIPFCLKRKGDIGPSTVTFDVEMKFNIRDVNIFKDSKVTFDEENKSYQTLLKIPHDPNLDWLDSKTLVVHLKMNSVHDDKEFTKRYWYSVKSLTTVEENLKDLYSNAYFHDLSFRIADKEFKLHKSILSARWPKLASTLNFNESSTPADTKDLSGTPPAILDKLFQFAYCGENDFMYQLDEIEGGMDVFNLVKKHNFYRLNNSITQLSPECESNFLLQSYRVGMGMEFTNVNELKLKFPVGCLRTCDIPLKPRHAPKSEVPMTPEALEKHQRHIRFMDVRLYVENDCLGFDWLKYSIVLGKIPLKNPVTVMCRLYVIRENEDVKENVLLSDQTHVFKEGHSGFRVHQFSTHFSGGKESVRYEVTSKPVITWDDLTDGSKEFLKKGFEMRRSSAEEQSTRDRPSEQGTSSQKDPSPEEEDPSPEEEEEEQTFDLHFLLELKLADGEYTYDERHGECIFEYKWDHKLFQDLRSVYGDKKFTDVEVTDKGGSVKVPAHKAVLAARSRILKAELLEKHNLPFLKTDIEPDCLDMFVHYLYTGLMPKVPSDKIDHLRAMAVKYELECLGQVLDESRNGTNGAEANGSEATSEVVASA